MAQQYEAGALSLVSREDYENRVIAFLEHLAPDIVVQRIIGRAPEANTLFSNWHTGWWKIRDQGRLCNYLNGRAVRRFLIS